MRSRKVATSLLLVAGILLVAPGCVTKKLFRKNVEETDTRMGSTESAVEANERRIGDLKSETDGKIAEVDSKAERAVEVGNAAMSRADQAAKAADDAAKGKLIWSVTLSDDRVKFSFNQTAIPDDAASALDELSDKVKAYGKAVYLEIEGHTDNTGGEPYNVALGEKRAMAVRDYLGTRGGIPLHAMNVISYGESKPIADNGSSEGRAQNRRVVIRVLE